MPRKPGQKQINSQVTQDTYRQLTEAAEKAGMNKAEYIREALYKQLEADGYKVTDKIPKRGTYPRDKE